MNSYNSPGDSTHTAPNPDRPAVADGFAQDVSADAHDAGRRLSVLLVTEGTYPYQWGGVSTWCHLLTHDVSDVDFTLLSIVAQPNMQPLFTLSPNVVAFHPIPLWGVLQAMETQDNVSLGEIRQWKNSVTEAYVIDEFLPLFRPFLMEMLTDDSDPERFGRLVHQIYRYFLRRDFDATLRSRAVWECFGQTAREYFPVAAGQIGYPDARFDLADLTWAMKWLYHWLFPLARPIPRADVVHTAMTGIASLIAVAAKYEYGSAFMLTEHGIYLRERYLAEVASTENLFLKFFKLRFARRTTELGYALAEQISPCCDYNQRWEYRNGARRAQMRTIYYGADASVFVPKGKPFGEPPVVVWVGRINPLKDVMTLIRAASLVHRERPDIEFRLFGSAPAGDEPYFEACLALRAELGMEKTVVFAGFTSNTAQAYDQGDIVVLSSVSEGFPFSTLEAMLCGKPVVATAVGGVPEQIEGCGIAVEPRNPRQLAEAVLAIMNDPAHGAALGQAARAKAVHEFSVRQSGDAHRSSYMRLAALRSEVCAVPATSGSASAAEEALPKAVGALREAGTYSVHMAYDAAGISVSVTEDGFGAGQSRSASSGADAPSTVDTAVDASEETNSPLLADLVADIERRVRRPIDSLEIAAVLESIGITDDLARQHYGMADTFDLAVTVLQQLRNKPAPVPAATPAVPEPSVSRREALWDYSRGPLAIVPGIVLLAFIQFCGILGHWGRSDVMALSLGLTGSMVACSGITQAVMRRASISMSAGNLAVVNRFFGLSLGWSFVAVAILGAALTGIAAWLGPFAPDEALIFGLAFVGLSALWLPGTALTVVKAQWWLGIGLAAGLLAGFVVAVGLRLIIVVATTAPLVALAGLTETMGVGPSALSSFSSWVLFSSVAVGFAVALAVILGAVYVKLVRPARHSEGQSRALPPTAYLLHEAAPYFAYGLLYMVFILTPHILGWLDANVDGELQWWAVSSLELGLTLSLPPIMLVGGVIEHALRIFWNRALAVQSETPGGSPHHFRTALMRVYRRHLMQYLAALTLMSAGVLILFQFGLTSGALERSLGVSSPQTLATVFYCGLIAYGLVGWGLYNSTFSVTLNLPRLATWAIVAGILVTLGCGIILGMAVDYRYTAISFIVGALVFVVLSSITVRRVLHSADYHYFASY